MNQYPEDKASVGMKKRKETLIPSGRKQAGYGIPKACDNTQREETSVGMKKRKETLIPSGRKQTGYVIPKACDNTQQEKASWVQENRSLHNNEY